MLREAVAMARAGGLGVSLGRASEERRQIPFGVVRQLLEPALAAHDAASREALFSGAAGLARTLVDPGAIAPAANAGSPPDRFAQLQASTGSSWAWRTPVRCCSRSTTSSGSTARRSSGWASSPAGSRGARPAAAERPPARPRGRGGS